METNKEKESEYEDEEDGKEIENCMICNKKLEVVESPLRKGNYIFKDAYLIQFSCCDYYCDNGESSVYSLYDFLLCGTCFKKYGVEALKILEDGIKQNNRIS